MKSFYITATGTGIGKTLVTCALAHQIRLQDKLVEVRKPVISGFDTSTLAATDTGILLAASGLSLTEAAIQNMSPWRFKAPLSPDQAAYDEDRRIEWDKLITFSQASSHAHYTLIEGAGGVMTPIDEIHTSLDWIAETGFPVILVTGSYLGSISHTLTSVESLCTRSIPIHAIVISESESSPTSLQRMQNTLQRFVAPQIRITIINRLHSCKHMWENAPSLKDLL